MGGDKSILVDWGSSNLRTFLVDGIGNVIDRRHSDAGVMTVPPGGFEAVLMNEIAHWADAGKIPRVLLSGMVGSRQGWIEVPYLDCPARVEALASGMKSATGNNRFLIAPGLRCQSPTGHFDVMRGEEVQVFGAVAHLDLAGQASNGIYCLPGTHSKWVRVENGSITNFTTYMTGELFAVLCAHSILGRMMAKSKEHDPSAFDAGIALALEGGSLLSHLFANRADVIMGKIAESGARSYLSGILVGHELVGQRTVLEGAASVTLVGAPALTQHYRRGLDRLGMEHRIVESEIATVSGLLRLASLRKP